LIADLAKESGLLEQRVMLGEDLEDPEAFLEELFQAWYVLLALRTIATHSSASYGRMARLVHFLPAAAPPLFADIADQFEVIKTMADGQREFLHGLSSSIRRGRRRICRRALDRTTMPSSHGDRFRRSESLRASSVRPSATAQSVDMPTLA
jgi:hypothetical protein